MRKLKIAIIDLVTKGPNNSIWGRFMYPNYSAIMPQAVASWCAREGHSVRLICYTGREDLAREVSEQTDLVFICAFTQAAQLAYAVSNLFRSRGAVTVLGGPHARCYPEDARKYFDFVVGFTNRKVIRDILQDCTPYRPAGICLSARTQPKSLPGVEERWEFIAPTLRKAPFIKIVPMIGSMGCPYSCSFCIDSEIPYQPLEFDVLTTDLRFLRRQFKRPVVVWHDPNFGIRFDEYLGTIEEAVPPGSIDFIAESSLAILTEKRLERLRRNSFVAMLPGIESWFDLGNKSKTGKREGEMKLPDISTHINLILRYIPYVQANFVLGLDSDAGPAPFELTKQFIDRVPGVFPGYSLLTAFGCAAPLNLRYQKENRVLPFPFHLLNNHGAMNVIPKNYDWKTFYDHLIGLTAHTYSWSRIAKRFRTNVGWKTRLMNFVRAISQEGFGRLRYFREIRRRLDRDPEFLPFFEGKTNRVPEFYLDIIRKDLGTLWHWLPKGALFHDPNAYLKTEMQALEHGNV